MLSEAETGGMLRALLPLLRLPEQLGEVSFALCVDGPAGVGVDADGEVIGARSDRGVVSHAPEAVPVADAWLRGTVPAWLDVLFDRGEPRLRMGGAPDLAEACLASLRGIFSPAAESAPVLS
jgi:hypothetical protein